MRARTSSYIVETELKLCTKDKHEIDKRISIAKDLYNMALGYCERRLKAVRANKEYRTLIKEKQELNNSKSKSEINKRLREIEKEYGYTEGQAKQFVNRGRKHFDGKPLGSAIVQNLVERAFVAVENIQYGKAKKVNYVPFRQEEFSIENKQNGTNITFRNGRILWAGLNLNLRLIIKMNI